VLQVMTGDDNRKMMYLANPENGKKVVSAAGPLCCAAVRLLGHQGTAGQESSEQAAGWIESQQPTVVMTHLQAK
jgi:hypothetical protein